MKSNSVFDAIVIGGGLNGLSSLYHLHRLGLTKLALFERFPLLHPFGSSHGTARISRSVYPTQSYIQLMKVAREEDWPQLEKECGQSFIEDHPACIFGPQTGQLEKYSAAVVKAGAKVSILEQNQAKKLFPQFKFQEDHQVLQDHTAGIIAAEKTLKALIQLARRNKSQLFENTQVSQLRLDTKPIKIVTNQGLFQTERLIITSGAWSDELLPFLKPNLNVIRQTIGYFSFPRTEKEKHPNFPILIYLGSSEELYYGLPDNGRLKFAYHETKGRTDIPTEKNVVIEKEKIENLKNFLIKYLSIPLEFQEAETCLYTMTATEDFILSLHPENSRVAIGAGFSGHGFKFGPLTGRILAELVLKKKTTIPEFESLKPIFSLT